MVFQSLHFSEESCKCQMIQNQTTSKSIIMEFLHAGFSNVTKCSATHMCYCFSLATFSVSVMDVQFLSSIFITYILFTIGVWPFCSLHRTTIVLLRTTSLQLLCNRLEC